MILSDKEIKEMIVSGELSISPFDDSQIQPAGVDFTLGNTFGRLVTSESEIILPGRMPKYEMITANRYLLDPGEFILASTREYFRFPHNLVAMIGGRSSYSRLGLFVQNTGWISPGFHGELTIAGNVLGSFCSQRPASRQKVHIMENTRGRQMLQDLWHIRTEMGNDPIFCIYGINGDIMPYH